MGRLQDLRDDARGCTRCPLYERATQTVFGEGREDAALVLVGEQPGDQEDREGKPFVGPAGRLLDRALAGAGIDRADVYLTNAVKHFKWTPRGKVRLHQKPDRSEISACHVWLEAEIEAVAPALVVLLGATAAQSMLGPSFRVTRERGRVIERAGLPRLLATVHPSSVLRSNDRERDFEALVADLSAAARALADVTRRA